MDDRWLFLAKNVAGTQSFQAVERQKGEEQHHDEPKQRTLYHRARRNQQLDVGRQKTAEQRRQRPLQHQAKHDAQQRAEGAEQQHDEVEIGHDEAAGSAECLGDGDRAMALAQKRGQRTLDADAGEHEREDTHQAQEEEKVGEEALHAGARGAEGVDAHEIASGDGPDLGGERVDAVGIGSLEQPAIGDARAGVDEVECGQIGGVDEDARAECEEGCRPVGFKCDDAANGQVGVAHAQRITNLNAQPVEQCLLHDDATGRKHSAQRSARGQRRAAVKGPARLHDLKIREQRTVFAAAAHDGIELPGADSFGVAARHDRRHGRVDGRVKGEVRLHNDVGANQGTRITGQRAVDAVSEAAQRHERHHRKRYAEQKNERLAAGGGKLAADEGKVQQSHWGEES